MRTTGREMRPVQAGAYRPRKARHTPASRELVKKVPLFLAPFIRQAADTPPGRLFAAVKKALGGLRPALAMLFTQTMIAWLAACFLWQAGSYILCFCS